MSPAATLVEALEPLRSDPSHAAVLLDIDGTLAPIVRHAADAHVPESTRTLLIEVARRYAVVGCVSGRRAVTARQIVAIGSIAYVGNHGGELLLPGATRAQLDPDVAAWTAQVGEFAARVYTAEHARLRVRQEDKEAIAAFHWRGAPNEPAANAAVQEIAQQAEAEGFAVHWGRKVLEVRPPVTLDKSLGVRALLGGLDDSRAGRRAVGQADGWGGGRAVDQAQGRVGDQAEGKAERPLAAAVYVGDDTTDLDAFRGLRELVDVGVLGNAICVGVASEETPAELLDQADLMVVGTDGVRELLEALL